MSARFIDVSRYFSHDSYPDPVCKNRDIDSNEYNQSSVSASRDLATCSFFFLMLHKNKSPTSFSRYKISNVARVSELAARYPQQIELRLVTVPTSVDRTIVSVAC